MLSIQDVSYRYRKQDKLLYSDVSFALEAGHIYGLLGKNGVGKSTLLYLINGLLKSPTGDITLHGESVFKRSVSVLEDIFLVPEEFELPSIKLQSYVKTYSAFYPKFSYDDFTHYLSLFEMSADVHLGRLSMGQKKKVFMAFALATNVSILLMDEPTNGLDIPSKSQFRKLIAAGMNDNRSIVISTHQVNDIDKLIDEILILEARGITLQASTYDITKQLQFVESDDRSLIEQAIFATPTLYGNKLILPNAEQEETELDLELLFNALHTKRTTITSLFQPQNK